MGTWQPAPGQVYLGRLASLPPHLCSSQGRGHSDWGLVSTPPSVSRCAQGTAAEALTAVCAPGLPWVSGLHLPFSWPQTVGDNLRPRPKLTALAPGCGECPLAARSSCLPQMLPLPMPPSCRHLPDPPPAVSGPPKSQNTLLGKSVPEINSSLALPQEQAPSKALSMSEGQVQLGFSWGPAATPLFGQWKTNSLRVCSLCHRKWVQEGMGS